MKYMSKTVVFDTLQAVYFIVILPPYFSSDKVYNDYTFFIFMSFIYLLTNFVYYSVYYLEKRNQEMQFNSHIIGAWSKVFDFEDQQKFVNPAAKKT